ncbi:MAG: hypothetical protein R3C28_00505 [Pirellulaceae bacterium]
MGHVQMIQKLKVSTKIYLLVALFAIGISVYGTWSYLTLSMTKVDGPYYHKIIQGRI